MKYYGIDFVDDFLFEKSVNQGLSIETIHTYTTVFNALCLNNFISIEDFGTYTEINFKRMLGELNIKNNWSSHTYNRYRKNLKCFCDYLVRNKHLKENPLKNILVKKNGKNLPKILNKKQIKQILKKVDIEFSENNFLGLRNKTIILFYLYTGCRLKEVLKLKIEDIDFLSGNIRINNGKGNKDRLIPLTYNLSDILINYLLKKKKFRMIDSILFPTRFGKILQHRDIYSFLKKIKKGLDFNFTPHMFRHSFATELLRKKVDIYSISRVLGHKSIKTTQIYLHLVTDDIKKEFNNIHFYS